MGRLEGRLEGHLGGSWGRRLEAMTEVSRDILGQILECFVRLEGQTSQMEA